MVCLLNVRYVYFGAVLLSTNLCNVGRLCFCGEFNVSSLPGSLARRCCGLGSDFQRPDALDAMAAAFARATPMPRPL